MHVPAIHLSPTDDVQTRPRAASDGFTIVTTDEDLPTLAFVKGHPPKAGWNQLLNYRTGQIESLIRRRVDDIRSFLNDPARAVLFLS